MSESNPTGHRAGWHAISAVPARARQPLTIDLDVDVCVVGGGLAGLTTAREVARRGWSVAVLEAEAVGSGASGRNCGFVLPGFAEEPAGIVSRVGLQHAKALWTLSERGLEYVRRTIRETRMPGVKPVDGWLNVAKFRDDPKTARTLDLLRDEFGTQAELWPGEQVRSVLQSPFYCNAIHFPRAFRVHPLNYTLGLAAAAEAAGARIFERTQALEIDPSGIRKRIRTPSARVRAAHVVLAGNTGIASLMPRVAASLLPITTYVAITAPLGPRLAEAVSYRGAVSDSQMADNHYCVVGDDRMLWSGGMTVWESDARRFARRLAADVARTFPQLGHVKIEHIWSGTLSRALHSMPQIGELSRGLWLASGFGGHGFNTTAIAGELIARGIVEGDQTWRLFSPYDLVWAGGPAGRIAAQALYWTRRAGELVKAHLARRTPAVAAQQTDAAPAVPPEPADREIAASDTPMTETPQPPRKQRVRRPKKNVQPGPEAAEEVSAER